MKPSEHPIKPPDTLSDAELARKCLENPGYTSVGIPYHLEKERRYRRMYRRLYVMAAIAAAAALASLLLHVISLIQ